MSAAHVHDTEGLVLCWFPYGETSQVVHLATPDCGRVVAMGKGSLRPGSSCQGGVATAMRGRATLRVRERSEMDLLVSWRLERTHQSLAREIERHQAGAYVLELMRLWMQPGLPAAELYRAGTTTLALLERVRREDVAFWIVWFEARALAAGGHRPHWTACVACGGADPEAHWFSPQAGGVVHGRCRAPGGESGGFPLGAVQLEALRRLYGERLGDFLRTPLAPDGVRAARRVHDVFVPYVLERKPRLLGAMAAGPG